MRVNKFHISENWILIFNDLGLDIHDVLTYARLPRDTFSNPNVSLTANQYFQLWQGIEKAGESIDLGLALAEKMTAEAFDPPIFAALCSDNLGQALVRLQQYKPLIGPLVLNIEALNDKVKLSVDYYGFDQQVPQGLALCEVVFFVELARMATREHIVPLHVGVPELPDNMTGYQAYFGCDLIKTDLPSLKFKQCDMELPFLTKNTGMWQFFESQLNQRLADLREHALTQERVKSVLIEALPSGQSDINYVASKLAMSKRTLQRKLNDEGLSFKEVLQKIRTQLAEHYLSSSRLPLIEISFLLGFKEPNSFARAFQTWTGTSPGLYREQFTKG